MATNMGEPASTSDSMDSDYPDYYDEYYGMVPVQDYMVREEAQYTDQALDPHSMWDAFFDKVSIITDNTPILPGNVTNGSSYNTTRDVTIVINYNVVHFTFHCVLTGLLCAFGLVGNICAIMVLLRDTKQTLISVLLVALCVSDWFLLVYIVISSVVPSACFYWQDCGCMLTVLPLLPFLWPWSTVAQTTMTWTVLAMSICRYMAVSQPFRSRTYSRASTGVKIALGVIVASLLFNLPRIFVTYFSLPSSKMRNLQHTTNSTNWGSDRTYPSCFQDPNFISGLMEYHVEFPSNNKWYRRIYYVGFTWLCVYIMPLVALVVLNIRLILALGQARRLHTELAANSDIENPSVTVNIIAIVTLFLCCQTPDFVSIILFLPPIGINFAVQQYFIVVSVFLQALNSSVNFLLYVVFYNRFRAQANNMFCRDSQSSSGRSKSSGVMSPSEVTLLDSPNRKMLAIVTMRKNGRETRV